MTQRKLNFDDSISSSDAGDVLIRSTRVGLQEENGRISRTAQENRQMSNLANQQIKISVRKLDSFLQSSSNDETSNSGSRGQPLVSADLRANKKPASSTGELPNQFHNCLHVYGASLVCLAGSICCPLNVCARNGNLGQKTKSTFSVPCT